MAINYKEYSSHKKSPDKNGQAELIGQRFGMLKVLGKTSRRMGSYVLYECVCDCGNLTDSTMTWLKQGRKKSCGCRQHIGVEKAILKNRTHAMTKTPTYKTWQGMRQRCENPNADQYPNYGARGIKVCDRWLSFEAFLSDMGERPDRMSIDRIDVNGDYCKENCKWSTAKEQSRNRRCNVTVVFNGKEMTISEYAELTGANNSVAGKRLRSKHNPPKDAYIKQ